MPEAEEFFIDGARHAAEAVGRLWRRHRPPPSPPSSPPALHLRDAKRRLELLTGAVLGCTIPIREAQPGAPPTLFRRLFNRGSLSAVPLAPLPANDGTAIYLPPSLPLDEPGGPDLYSLLALLQALRCERGSVALLGSIATGLTLDLYLFAEAVAVEHALRRLMPGWRTPLDALRTRSARQLDARRPVSRQAAEVSALYRRFLSGAGGAPPFSTTPAEALDWAMSTAQGIRKLAPAERHVPWLGDLFIGRLLFPEGSPSRWRRDSAPANEPAQDPADARHHTPLNSPRNTPLSRRPRVRQADNEDDASPGVWMIQTAEPLPHAEDPFGLQRPEDREADDDPQGSAESLAEMAEARLVQTPSPSRESFSSSDPPPRASGIDPADQALDGLPYPEWDGQLGAYRPQAVRVHLKPAAEGPADWATLALARHAGMLRDIRRRLGAIRPQRSVLKGRTEGEDIDWDALVAERSERRAGLSPAGAFYQSRLPTTRRLGLLILVDASASTDAPVDGHQRVIDVEKEATLVAASALQSTKMAFAIQAFSGEGPQGVRVWEIKSFDEPWDITSAQRLGSLEPDRYTRLGAALRHATQTLKEAPAEHRLLLLFSDGRPNDCDRYASRYGVDDARQALIEARQQGITPYCFTIDRDGGGYLPAIFGGGRYSIVQKPQHLPQAFIAWLRHAIRQCHAV